MDFKYRLTLEYKCDIIVTVNNRAGSLATMGK